MVVGRSGGRVGEAEVKTNSAQLKLGLGLSLAKTKKTLKRNPEAKCMVCTWLKNTRKSSQILKSELKKS